MKRADRTGIKFRMNSNFGQIEIFFRRYLPLSAKTKTVLTLSGEN